MRSAKLSSKSQIVIPADVRRKLGLRPGDVLSLEVNEDSLVLRKGVESWLAELEEFVGDPALRGLAKEIERSREEWEEHSREREGDWFGDQR